MIIAIIGAESTGKTTLAPALAARIGALSGLACTSVGEHLRCWCDEHGRTPRPDEQAAIAARQASDIDAAAGRHDVVVADTTPLMTAVYSLLLFGDASLVVGAVDFQRRCDATLLTALDLPWIADGLQRDGEHVREPVDARLREILATHQLPWSVIGGAGERRAGNALDAVAPLLRERGGVFTRLARQEVPTARWSCALCDDADCEHRSLLLRRA